MGEFRVDGSVGSDPVGKGIFAILDDGLAGLIAIVSIASLSWSYGGVIDEFKEMLSVASDDGKLFAVFAERIKLVGKSSLDLLASDVGQLRLGDKRLGFSTNEFLLEDNNLWGVWFLVLELGNLVRNLLLAYCDASK